jgi:hypothetical protein
MNKPDLVLTGNLEHLIKAETSFRKNDEYPSSIFLVTLDTDSINSIEEFRNYRLSRGSFNPNYGPLWNDYKLAKEINLEDNQCFLDFPGIPQNYQNVGFKCEVFPEIQGDRYEIFIQSGKHIAPYTILVPH